MYYSLLRGLATFTSLTHPLTDALHIPSFSSLLLAKSSGLLKKALRSLSKFGSGSRVKKKQHVLFKAIWNPPVNFDQLVRDAKKYNLKDVWQDAANLVESSGELERSLALVEKPENFAPLTEIDLPWPGSWIPVLQWQTRVLEFCKRKPPPPPPPTLETPSTGTRSQIGKRKRDTIRMQETAELVGWLKKSYAPWNEHFNGQIPLHAELSKNLIPHRGGV
ncbi:hypothetical protein BDV37DRAFT_286777 [Aspergillus pseudonomiae]|uniref:Uncharacterized protein n=1 Tax=Aspergillus pseudonomiae TaxID=1506151 RepID=A0A5N7D211_9EURO|nr:uncharacterized protein BDV37DRAFT_286777 [Aspergillus pseudonomiae]KAE8400279.1 hypothetical protein BDV37DRAFT_286777 [Aspergillus pseudonomiae]